MCWGAAVDWEGEWRCEWCRALRCGSNEGAGEQSKDGGLGEHFD
jgi:hypothetical protein